MTTKTLSRKSGSPEVVPAASAAEAQTSLIGSARRIVSAQTLSNEETKLVNLLAPTFVSGNAYTKKVEAVMKEMRAHRLMFPAQDSTRAILGDNAPDLIGATKEYQSSWGRVTAQAIEQATALLVEEGASEKAALANAREEAETFRKSVSRRFRLTMESEARKLGEAKGRIFLLAHGFAYNGECGKGQLLHKGSKLVLPAGSPEGTALTAANAVYQLETSNAVQTGQPATSTDAVPAGQTVEATTNALVDATQGDASDSNVVALLAAATEALHRALGNLGKDGSTSEQVQGAYSALLAQLKAFDGAFRKGVEVSK